MDGETIEEDVRSSVDENHRLICDSSEETCVIFNNVGRSSTITVQEDLSYVSRQLSPRENSRFFNRLLIKSCGKSQLVTRLPGNMLSCGNNNLKFINFFPCGGSS